MGIFHCQQGLGAGEEPLVGVPPGALLPIVDAGGLAGLVVVDGAALQGVVGEIADGVRLHGQGGVAIVHAVVGGGQSLLPEGAGGFGPHPLQQAGSHVRQLLLPPVEVGAVVVLQRQQIAYRQIGEVGGLFPQALGEGPVVQRRITVGGGQKGILVRDHRQIQPAVRAGEIGVVQVVKAPGGVGDGVLLHGVLQTGDIALRQIYAVGVPLAQ